MKQINLLELSLLSAGIIIPLIYPTYVPVPLEISIVEVFTVLILTGFVLRARKQKLSLTPTLLDWLFLIMIFWSAFSIPRAIDPAKTWRELILLIDSFIIFYCTSHSMEGESFPKYLKFWCYGCTVVAVSGIVEFIIMVKADTNFLFNDHGFMQVALRSNSTFLHANSLSGYLIMFVPVAAAFIISTKTWDKRFYWLLSGAAIAGALIFTYTRAGWLASVVSLTVFAFLLRNQKLMVAFWSFIGLAILTFPNVIQRALSVLRPGSDLASLQRAELWEAALIMWKEHPVAGVGMGNYYLLLMKYADQYPQLKHLYRPLEPHNSFLKFLAESGIIGFGIFTVLIAILIFGMFKFCLRTRNRVNNTLHLGVFSGLLAFLIQSNTNSLFHDPPAAVVFWLISGITVSAMTREATTGIRSNSISSSQTIKYFH